ARGRARVPQGGVSPEDRLVQGPRRLQPVAPPDRRGACPRPHHHLRGQPRAGPRVRRGPRGHRLHGRVAGARPALDGRGVARARAPLSQAVASRAYGADVALHGSVFEAFEKCEALRREHGFTLVHPFDDPDIIAGQGTVGLEILEDAPDADVVVVPIGGGGLISGIATAAKALRPTIRVIGIEPEGAAGMTLALRDGAPTRLERIDTVADGLAAPAAGPN